jgi:CubicO group peptidase (beta-lactamase class C family)
MTAAQRKNADFVPGFWDGVGWGLGLAVSTRPDPRFGHPAGVFGWDGGLGTSFAVDPTSHLTGVLMTQRSFTSPTAPPVVQAFWRAAHA